MKRTLNEDEEPEVNVSKSLWQDLLDRVSVGVKGSLKAQLVNFESLSLEQQKDCLQSIADAIPSLSKSDRYALSEAMMAKLETAPDADIKVMIITVLENYARMPYIDARKLLAAFVRQLDSDSSRVRCHLYMCIITIVENRLSRDSNELKNIVSEISRRINTEMTDPDHQLRATCLKLISLLPFLTGGKRLALLTKAEQAQKMLIEYAYDRDYRVRKSALDSLDSLRLRGCPLNSALYQLVSVSLKDDYEQVRLSGLNLISAISRQSPDIPMKLKNHGNESIRLIDVAFTDICDLVNDISLAVRTKACIVLASYQQVDFNVLQQTFSKQLMKGLKRIVARSQQTKALIPLAEGDADAGTEEFRILDSGACGAFIHGLEDEFEEVRSASIDSICELCEYNDQLVGQAVVYLVDMFNDEIEKVRVNAIQSLRKIGSLWTLELNAELLEIALGALDDSDPVTRHAMHGLLKVVRLTEMTLLTVLLDALVANIKRNSEDLLSVYECLSEIGRKHEDYVALYIPTLLKLDKRYLPKEANVEDIAYASNAILIVNACLSDPTILSKVPKFMFPHFTYFKSKYPTCVPDLEKLYKNAPIRFDKSIYSETVEIDQSFASSGMLLTGHEDTSIIFELIKARITRKDFSAAAQAIAVAKRNFAHLKIANPKSAGNARLAVMYLEVYEEMIKVKQNLATPSMAHMASEVAAKLMRLSYSMQNTFYGCSAAQLETAIFLRTVANIVLLFGLLKGAENTKEAQRFLLNALSGARQRINTFKINANAPNDIISAISNLRDIVSENNSAKSLLKLHTFIANFSLPALHFDNHVKCTTATITEPTPNPDKPFKFVSKAPVSLRIVADIKNAFDHSGIAVEISLPDNSTQLWWPSTYDFTPTSPGRYSLKTQVLLELQRWTEPSNICIHLVRSFDPDVPFLDTSIMKYPNKDRATRNAQMVATVPISQDVSYTLFPTHSI